MNFAQLIKQAYADGKPFIGKFIKCNLMTIATMVFIGVIILALIFTISITTSAILIIAGIIASIIVCIYSSLVSLNIIPAKLKCLLDKQIRNIEISAFKLWKSQFRLQWPAIRVSSILIALLIILIMGSTIGIFYNLNNAQPSPPQLVIWNIIIFTFYGMFTPIYFVSIIKVQEYNLSAIKAIGYSLKLAVRNFAYLYFMPVIILLGILDISMLLDVPNNDILNTIGAVIFLIFNVLFVVLEPIFLCYFWTIIREDIAKHNKDSIANS
jgi:hypothetical protein